MLDVQKKIIGTLVILLLALCCLFIGKLTFMPDKVAHAAGVLNNKKYYTGSKDMSDFKLMGAEFRLLEFYIQLASANKDGNQTLKDLHFIKDNLTPQDLVEFTR